MQVKELACLSADRQPPCHSERSGAKRGIQDDCISVYRFVKVYPGFRFLAPVGTRNDILTQPRMSNCVKYIIPDSSFI